MLISIMRMFPGYDMEKILDTPMAIVRVLYRLAERALLMTQYDIAVGVLAPKDAKYFQQLASLANDREYLDQEAIKTIYSEENVRRARQRADEMMRNVK